MRKALRDAGLTPDEVKGVVMVGGATRMPQVQRAVRDFFRRDPLNNLDPEQGGRARRRDAGERARRQQAAGRGLAAARRDPPRSASRPWAG